MPLNLWKFDNENNRKTDSDQDCKKVTAVEVVLWFFGSFDIYWKYISRNVNCVWLSLSRVSYSVDDSFNTETPVIVDKVCE